MKLYCLPVEEEEKEFRFQFKNRDAFETYQDGLVAYARKLPKEYRTELTRLIVKLSSSAYTTGDTVTTSLMEMDALKFFSITTSAIASVSLAAHTSPRS